MPGTYTINTEPFQARSYPNKHQAGEDLIVWRLGLDNARSVAPDGLFELHKKPGNEPKQGDVLDVSRTQEGEFGGERFTRLFLAKPQQGASSSSTSSSSGGGSKTYERQPDHPLNMARALHTSALSSTPAFIDQLLTINAVPQPQSEDEYWALVGRVCGRLRASYPDAVLAQAAPAAAVQTAGNGAGGQQLSDVPADMPELQPAAAPAGSDEDIPF